MFMQHDFNKSKKNDDDNMNVNEAESNINRM